MYEIMSTTECVEDALNIQEKLALAKTPTEVIDAIHGAICHIRNFDEEATLESRLQLEDPLTRIHAEVTDIFQRNVLPKQYKTWWEGVKKECSQETLELLHIKNALTESPCSNADEYQIIRVKIAQRQEGYSQHRINDLYPEWGENGPLPISTERFAPWKEEEILRVNQRISEIELTKKKLEEGAPEGFPL